VDRQWPKRWLRRFLRLIDENTSGFGSTRIPVLWGRFNQLTFEMYIGK
jgi:hypothetical protein